MAENLIFTERIITESTSLNVGPGSQIPITPSINLANDLGGRWTNFVFYNPSTSGVNVTIYIEDSQIGIFAIPASSGHLVAVKPYGLFQDENALPLLKVDKNGQYYVDLENGKQWKAAVSDTAAGVICHTFGQVYTK